LGATDAQETLVRGRKPEIFLSPTQIEGDVAAISKRWKTKRGSLIMALHGLQDRYGYVPREAAMSLGEQMDVPLARIYEVLTFYNYFRLKSPGKHVVSVCMGTACYLKGAPRLLDEASERLGISPGETSPDGEYHLQVVRCVGCCGLAPVVTVNAELLAKVTSVTLEEHLSGGKASATVGAAAAATVGTMAPADDDGQV